MTYAEINFDISLVILLINFTIYIHIFTEGFWGFGVLGWVEKPA